MVETIKISRKRRGHSIKFQKQSKQPSPRINHVECITEAKHQGLRGVEGLLERTGRPFKQRQQEDLKIGAIP